MMMLQIDRQKLLHVHLKIQGHLQLSIQQLQEIMVSNPILKNVCVCMGGGEKRRELIIICDVIVFYCAYAMSVSDDVIMM